MAVAFLMTTLLISGGCKTGLLDDGALAVPADQPELGEVITGLRLMIPRFSPWLQDAISDTQTIDGGSRALAVADSFRVIVKDSLDIVVHNQLYTPSGAVLDTQVCDISLATGSDYSVEVKIYNNDNGYDDGLVVQGSVGDITIIDGQSTTVSIPCTPVYPIGFTVGTVSGTIDLITTQLDGSCNVLEPGEEFWMIFQAPASGIIRILPDFIGTAVCEHVIGIYTQSGEPVKSFSSTPPTVGNVLVEGLTAGATYYGLLLPLSETRETVSGTILIDEVQPGDCGYTGVDARSVSGAIDFSAFDISGATISAVKVLASLPDTGGSLEGLQIIYPVDFTGFTATYTLTGMDPALTHDVYYQVTAEYDGTEYQPFDGPHNPYISSGDVTGYDHTFAEAYIAEITVNMSYTGAGTVDLDHPLVVSMDLMDYGYVQDSEYLYSNSGQVTLRALIAQATVFIEAAYWVAGTEEQYGHDDWDPMCFYGEIAEDRTPEAINISSGPVNISFTLNDTIRFNVDDRDAYPLAIDGTWCGPRDGFGTCTHFIDSGPVFIYTFESEDGTYSETYRVWEWDNASGFLVLQMMDCSIEHGGLGKYFPTGWDNLEGSGEDATFELFGYGDGTDYYKLDTLEAARVASRSNPMPVLLLSASPQPMLTLEDTRVDVMVDYSYTGTAVTSDRRGAVMLVYSYSGPVFAGIPFDEASDPESYGNVSFADPLVPISDQVFVQIYIDADDSYSLSDGDPYYRHPAPISVDGGHVNLAFDDAATCTSSCPELAGGWLADVSGWGDMVISITEDAFAILRDTEIGDPTYEDVESINNFGIITEVYNGITEGYVIGQWTHHPAGEAYEGKYMKIRWEDWDGFRLTEIYYGFETEAQAIAADTGATAITGTSMIW